MTISDYQSFTRLQNRLSYSHQTQKYLNHSRFTVLSTIKNLDESVKLLFTPFSV